MNNVTEYLKKKGIYSDYKIYNFLRLERVKYLIAKGAKVETKPGRYKSGTFFDDDLFLIFQSWLRKEPIPLLNRKEYEVQQFINELFGDEVVRQYSLDSFLYDWYVPSLNLLIEFHEKEHAQNKHIKKNDLRKMRSNLFVIHEATVMKDLARLVKNVRRHWSSIETPRG